MLPGHFIDGVEIGMADTRILGAREVVNFLGKEDDLVQDIIHGVVGKIFGLL